MATEIKKVLEVDTGESTKSIKQLRDEIKRLKTEYESAEIGSEKFERASNDLAIAQADLKTALVDGKKATDNAEGSYNHLAATMAELKKQWRATADEVKRNELGAQIDSINDRLKGMDSSIGNNQRLVGSYAEEFKKALNEQQDATIATKTKLESLQKVTSGLASGYAALQGVTALLGIENENLEKTFVKVQSAMAIAQGVGGLKDLVEGLGSAKVAFADNIKGVKAFITGLSGVKKAIAATGIGLLVVAIGTLVANWDDFISLVKKDSGELNKLENSVKDLKLEMAVKDDDFDYFIKLQEAAGKSRREILKLIEAKKSDDFNKANEVYEAAVDSLQNYESTFWGDLFGGKADREKALKIVNEAKEIRDKAYNDWQQATQNLELFDVEKEREERDAAIAAAKDLANNQKKLQEELYLYFLDEQNRELKQVEISAREKAKIAGENATLIEEIERWKQAEIDRINLEYSTKEKERKEKELEEFKRLQQSIVDFNLNDMLGMYNSDDLMQTYQLQLDALEVFHNEELISDQEYWDKKKELEENYVSESNRIQEEYLKSQVEYEKVRKNQIYDTINGIGSIIGSMSEIVGKETKAGKALAVSQALISTFLSAQQAYQSAFLPVPTVASPVLAGVSMAAAIASGLANVRNILKVNEKGQTNVGNTSSSPAASSPAAVPNITTSVPMTQVRNIQTDAEIAEMNKAQKVYVLESDITTAQKRVEVRENNASF